MEDYWQDSQMKLGTPKARVPGLSADQCKADAKAEPLRDGTGTAGRIV